MTKKSTCFFRFDKCLSLSLFLRLVTFSFEVLTFSSSFDNSYGKLHQIPTRTGAVVHAFHLHIASPQAVILGGQVSHVDIHTPSLTLVCIVDNVNIRLLIYYTYIFRDITNRI